MHSSGSGTICKPLGAKQSVNHSHVFRIANITRWCIICLQANFVGKIVGPGGATINSLHEETGCRLAVFGRGSIRDKSKVCILHLLSEFLFRRVSIVKILWCFSGSQQLLFVLDSRPPLRPSFRWILCFNTSIYYMNAWTLLGKRPAAYFCFFVCHFISSIV